VELTMPPFAIKLSEEPKSLAPIVAGKTAVVKTAPDERLFAMFLAHCVQGMLAANAKFDGAFWQEYCDTEDELVQRAWSIAEKMVEVVKSRREVERFQEKVQE